MQTNNDLGRVALADRLARDLGFGSLKFAANDSAEMPSHLVREDVALTRAAARLGIFLARACWCSAIRATSLVGFKAGSEASTFFCSLTYCWTRAVKILKTRASSSLAGGTRALARKAGGTTNATNKSQWILRMG